MEQPLFEVLVELKWGVPSYSAVKWYDNFLGKVPKNRELRTIQPEIPRRKSNRTEIQGNVCE